MSRNVEELLREGIDRLAAGPPGRPRTPATLLHRARQHNRRWRQALASAIAAGTAAVTAAAALVATAGPPGSNAGARHGQTITYVATRAEQALAQLNPGRAIEMDTLTARGGSFGFGDGMQSTAANLPGHHPAATQPRSAAYTPAPRSTGPTTGCTPAARLLLAAGKLVYTLSLGSQGEYGAAYPPRIRWHNPLTGG